MGARNKGGQVVSSVSSSTFILSSLAEFPQEVTRPVGRSVRRGREHEQTCAISSSLCCRSSRLLLSRSLTAPASAKSPPPSTPLLPHLPLLAWSSRS
eukprot:92808-Hanusia_phi.AAC.3